MGKMKFHWEKEDQKGSFTVTADSDEECIQTAEEEIQKNGAELVDWYTV